MIGRISRRQSRADAKEWARYHARNMCIAPDASSGGGADRINRPVAVKVLERGFVQLLLGYGRPFAMELTRREAAAFPGFMPASNAKFAMGFALDATLRPYTTSPVTTRPKAGHEGLPVTPDELSAAAEAAAYRQLFGGSGARSPHCAMPIF